MYAVTSQKHQSLSPHQMKFQWWSIFDLRSFHSFWREKVQDLPRVFCDNSIWSALLKAYRLQTFSPLSELEAFASDFHLHFKNKISSKNIHDTFQIFRNLGLQRLAHLRRLPTPEIQKRFGKAWAFFLNGVNHPDSAPWIWQPAPREEVLQWQYELESTQIDSRMLSQAIADGLIGLSAEHPHTTLLRIETKIILSEVTESFNFDFCFTHRPPLQKSLPWIVRLFEEKLSQLSLPYPPWKIFLNLHPAAQLEQVQLSLFEDRAKVLEWKQACQRLEDQGFQLFQPECTNSYIPESAWKRGSIQHPLQLPTHGLLRPMIQGTPTPRVRPEGALYFTEHLSWFDETGRSQQRDYFITRSTKKWLWVFRDQQGQWFSQGVIE